MKTTNLIVGGLLLFSALIAGCNKAEVIPAPTSEETETTSIGNRFKEYMNSKVQTYVVDANTPTTIYGNQGTKVVLSGSNFSVSGNVTLELLEIYKKSDMVLMNKATLANQGGQVVPISSGGEFRITVSQNGAPVQIVNDIAVSTNPSNTTTSNMELFGGTTDAEGNIIWDADGTLTFGQDSLNTSFWYDFPFSGDYDWVNCDYFWSYPNPQTSVMANLPAYCDGTNSAVFLVFTAENATTTLSSAGANSNVFETGGSYTIPEGLGLHFVVVSEIAGQLKYAIQQSTIVPSHVETIPTLTDVNSLAELGLILDGVF